MTSLNDLVKSMSGKRKVAKSLTQISAPINPTVAKLDKPEEPTLNNPLAALASTLGNMDIESSTSITDILGDSSTEIAAQAIAPQAVKSQSQSLSHSLSSTKSTPSQSQSLSTQNPTLDDVSNFVFDEQPEHTNQEIMDQFSTLLSSLQTATPNDIGNSLAETLKFMQDNSFLAGILKPESIGLLVNSMRKSYGRIAAHQGEKAVKKTKRIKKEEEISDLLSGFGGFGG